MDRKTKGVLAGVGAVAVLAGGGAAIAGVTNGSDDGESKPVAGAALERASAVALREAGGGEVTGSELGDEEGYYEIEVTKPDGTQVDVHLDRDFNLLDASGDGSGSDDGDRGGG